jgi:hypothetical protein
LGERLEAAAVEVVAALQPVFWRSQPQKQQRVQQ